MTNFNLKYNPFKIETIIMMNGEKVKQTSSLNISEGIRLQEWIDEIPERFRKECNSREFTIDYEGSELDFEDVKEIVDAANENGSKITLNFKESAVKKNQESIENELKIIFREIQDDSPFDDLKSETVKTSFDSALSNECPVDVIATMSAGKSTLINALLGKKLMPSKQEACTAIITKIHDNDIDSFSADVFDSDDKKIKFVSDLTLDEMKRINEDKSVSNVDIKGNIPFVTSDELSLVLVDTPGPNNARDESHKTATYRMIEKSSKELVIYVLNAAQLAVNDDSNLLSYVAQNMKTGGKQSRDRFIFVVNKLDEFRSKDDDIPSTLEKVREYLESKGIENPKIFPVSALTALQTRTVLADKNIYEKDSDAWSEEDEEVGAAVSLAKRVERNEKFHFEEFASLGSRQNTETKAMLAAAEEKFRSDCIATKSEGLKELAVIHSGITSLEDAIKLYILKYARTAKIKNAVDTFKGVIESSEAFAKVEHEIASNEEERNKIRAELSRINEDLQSKDKKEEFSNKIDKLNLKNEVDKLGREKLKPIQANIKKQIENENNKKMTVDEATKKIEEFRSFIDGHQSIFQIELEDLVTDYVKKAADALLNEYSEKLQMITGEGNTISIPLGEFIAPEMDRIMEDDIINRSIRTEKVELGTHKERNPNRKWYKPWTWKDVEVTDYIDHEYVDGKELAQKFYSPYEANILENVSIAGQYADEQCIRIKKEFRKKFEEFDEILRKKMEQLEEVAKNEDNYNNKIAESKEKLDWLNSIKNRLDEIMEI